ncbi:hypothetical protein HY358_00965, partial [Candidatus Roizmanbacteria bacterium]|nr:hypothetical protein [Candidatus Roizmanbacteria bacterium]
RNLSLYIISFLILTTYYILHTTWVSAQESISIRLTPIRHEIQLRPGEESEIPITLYNPTDTVVVGSFKAYDFMVQEKNGAPTIFEDPTSLSTRYSARTWINIPANEIAIPVQESITLPITISIPNDALPGEKYAAVFFEMYNSSSGENNPNNGTNVYTGSRIGSLVTIRIPGITQEKADVSAFSLQRIIEQGPITIAFEIHNSGSYKIRPQGTLSIADLIGNVVEEQKLPEYNIFPDASRAYQFQLGTRWMLGKYRITLSAVYGNQGQTIIQSTDIWIIPWKVVITLILFLLILYFLIKHLQQAPRKVNGDRENTVRLLKQSRKRD